MLDPRQLSQTLIQSVEEAVIITDGRLAILDWNAAMERLTGVSRERAIGRHAREVAPFLRQATLGEHLEHALRGEVVATGEVACRISERREGWLEARYLPWREEDGHVAGVIGFHSDVTERHHRAAVIRAIEAIGHSLTSTLDLNEVLDTIVNKALEVMSAESALVASWDGHSPAFTVMRAAGRLSRMYSEAGPIPVSGGPLSRAVLQSRPVTTSNILSDEDTWLTADRRAQIDREGFKAVAAAPLESKGRVHGALVVHYWTERTFGDDDRAALMLLAKQAAVAIDNARVFADATRRAERLRELVAVSQSVNASLDPRDVMVRIAHAAAAISPGALAAVDVFDAERRTLRVAARSSDALDGLLAERPYDAGLRGLVTVSRAPVLVAEPLKHPATLALEWWRQRPGLSYYGVPIALGDTLVGVLNYYRAHGVPELEEQEALRLLAVQAGVAFRNASLYENEHRQTARIRTLAAVNQRLSSALALGGLLREISESAAQLTRVRFVSFWLADERLRELSFHGGSVPEIAADFPHRTVSYDVGGVGWIARHRASLVVDDVESDGRIANREWWARWGLRSFVGYPVVAGDALLAILVLSHSEPVRFDPETGDVIDMFVAQASVAVQNARLYREAERRRDVAEILARLGRELTDALDVKTLAQVISRGVVNLLGARGSAVYRYDESDGALHVMAAHGEAAAPVRSTVLQPGEGAAGRAVVERRLIVVPDMRTDPGYQVAELRPRRAPHDVGTVVGVPLLTRERVVGAIALGHPPGHDYSVDELRALQAFADQAALALDNARLYENARESLTRLRDTQAQLVQAAKMSAIGQLVSGVAHELNNPLSVIIGYGQLLLAREVPEAMRRPVELMVSQGDRMAKIVRNLLYFSRQRPPERAHVDLNTVFEQTLMLRLNQLKLSGIRVEKDFAPTLPPIEGDAHQLEQVFLNLLLNAEQAILDARTGGCILLRTRVHGKMVEAQIIDDGPGIPPAAVARVFEPFFTTKSVGTGTGLGLSVSYGIIEEHGGRLSVQSEPGSTVFTLELPIVGMDGEEAEEVEEVVEPKEPVALLVEDEPAVVDFMITLFGTIGWRVDVAEGARSALEHIRRRHYDLVVSDMRLPEGSGEEFFRGAVAHDPGIARRFVFMTGDTAHEGGWSFLQGTTVPVLEKPFPPARFLEVVQQVTNGGDVVG
jgi:PAS domain S-box-containing protein